MYRITVSEAERDFANLVNRVYSEGIPVELQRGGEVIAHLAGLPKLGEDADAFLEDVRAIHREFPPETNPWP